MIEIIGPALNQWDTGRSVKVTDIEAGHVHFANKGDAKAVIMEIVDSQAKIPDYLFQTGKQLCVYAVKDGVTLESKVFYVKHRERPENYVYEDDQRNYIYELISKAETAIEGAYSAYEDAHAAVEAANEAVVNANIAIENTNKAVGNANLAASNANEAATQAAKTANDAAANATQTVNEAAAKAVQTANDAAVKASHTAKSLMVIGGAEGVSIHLDDAAEQYLVGLRIFGKTTQDGTPTPTAPVELKSSIGGAGLSVHVCSKNLFTGWLAGGVNADSGKFNDLSTYRRTDYIPIAAPGQMYNISNTPDTLYNFIAFYDEEKNFIKRTAATPTKNRRIDPPENAKYFVFTIYENPQLTGLIAEAEAMAVSTMIEAGVTVTEHERGKPVQTAVITSPNVLHGIPVVSGGNRTDENGQQWICDEIDFDRGVYVKRLSTVVLDGSSDENWVHFTTISNQFHVPVENCYHSNSVPTVYSTHFAPGIIGNREDTYEICYSYSAGVAVNTELATSIEEWRAWLVENPITMLYRLNVPEELPLSEEDIAAYKALYTHREATTICNTGFAHMEIEYVMDAKKYIDSLIAAPASAARIAYVSLPASKWTGSDNLYSQVVYIAGITENSQVNLAPSVEQLAIFYEKDITFVTENDGGVVTVYVIGQKPQNDYTIQADIVEVIA